MSYEFANGGGNRLLPQLWRCFAGLSCRYVGNLAADGEAGLDL